MFWHDIELLIITVILIVIIVLDVWMKDESALLEKYVDKKEFSKNIDITNKSLMNNTIYTTKEDLLTARSFRKDPLLPQNKDQNRKQAIYNKFGTLLIKDTINQNIGDFNKLIHEENSEDVYSQYSGTIAPNKAANEMNPFTEKYNEGRGSPNRKNIKASAFNYRPMAANSNFNQNDPRRSSPDDRRDRTGSLSTSRRNSSINDTEIQNADLNADSIDMGRRRMMRTAGVNNKLPKFVVEGESTAVINSRNDLRVEIEKKSTLQNRQNILDQDIVELKDQINELEKEKLKIKLRKDSISGSSSNSGNHKLRKDTDTGSIATQYDINHFIRDNNDKVRENVEQSLKVESTASQWLKNNKKLVCIINYKL